VTVTHPRWSAILDAEVAADEAPARHLAALRIPKLDGWEPRGACGRRGGWTPI
jgi:hypothetical protein